MSPDDTFHSYPEGEYDPFWGEEDLLDEERTTDGEFVEDEEALEEPEFLSDPEIAAIFDDRFIGPPEYDDWLNYSGDINHPHHGSN